MRILPKCPNQPECLNRHIWHDMPDGYRLDKRLPRIIYLYFSLSFFPEERINEASQYVYSRR